MIVVPLKFNNHVKFNFRFVSIYFLSVNEYIQAHSQVFAMNDYIGVWALVHLSLHLLEAIGGLRQNSVLIRPAKSYLNPSQTNPSTMSSELTLLINTHTDLIKLLHSSLNFCTGLHVYNCGSANFYAFQHITNI